MLKTRAIWQERRKRGEMARGVRYVQAPQSSVVRETPER